MQIVVVQYPYIANTLLFLSWHTLIYIYMGNVLVLDPDRPELEVFINQYFMCSFGRLIEVDFFCDGH